MRQKIVFKILFLGMLASASTVLAQTASINAGTTNQFIRGFGASSAWHTSAYTPAQATIFWDTAGMTGNNPNGIGLSMLRCRIPPDATNGELAVMQQAKNTYGVTQIWATEWSAPASMKSNNNLNNGGTLLAASYAAYASKLLAYANLCQSNGITLMCISPQNEPDQNVTYESGIWTGQVFHDFVLNNLGPTFAGNATKIMIPEPSKNNLLTSGAAGDGDANTTLADANAAKYVTYIGTHLYGSGPLAYANTQQNAPPGGREYWETEMMDYGSGGASDDSMTDGMATAKLIQGSMIVGSMNAYHFWWLVCENSNTNQGLIDFDGTTVPKRTWCMGNFSRFVRPGYYRMGGTITANGGISISAYKDNAGTPVTFVIVALNTNGSTSSQTFSFTGFNATSVTPWVTDSGNNLTKQTAIAVSGGSFTATLSANSVWTFVGVNSVSGPTATFTFTPTKTNTPTNTFTNTPTKTNTPSNTFTNSPTNTATRTPTNSSTNTPMPATNTSTNTPTRTPTLTFTNTLTNSPTRTTTNSPTNTAAIPTNTSTNTPSATPFNSPTRTATTSPTNSPANTMTNTVTNSPSNSPTRTATPTITNTPTNTPMITNTATHTPTNSLTATPSNSSTRTATSSPTNSPANSMTNTATNSPSNSPTRTATPTITNTPTSTPMITNTATHTPTNSLTPTPSNSSTRTATSSPTNSPANTMTNTATNSPSNSPTRTATLTITNTPTNTPMITNTATHTPTNTATNSPSNSPTRTATPTITDTPTNTLLITNTATQTPTNSLTATPSNSSTRTSTVSPTNSPSNSPTRTATSSPTNSPSNSPTRTATLTITDTPTNTPIITSTATNTPTSTPTSVTLPVTLGPVPPTSSNQLAGVTLPVLQFQLSNPGTNTTTLTSVTLTGSGTGNFTTGITTVSLYLDNNANGVVDGGDTLVGTATYSGGTVVFNITTPIPAGATKTLLVTYNFSNTAQPGSYTADLTGASGTNATGAVQFSGLPMTGASVSIVTATSTPTNTFTSTFTSTSTPTMTPTASFTATSTSTSTSTSTFTSTATPTATATSTSTSTSTTTGTSTPTPNLKHDPIIYPNPAPGDTVNILPPAYPGITNVRVEIFTLSFRLVQDKTFDNIPSGVSVQVNLTDRWGRTLANGIYYVVVTVNGHRSIAKLLILH